ncbi:uncharacterized protein LOC115701265 [Cannabis sativa]|uniref:uncharacterized protein LOC115701265 n=1 Tax=Cannabis sativa TaxID=3483 RepID=UPI0029CA766B|nr:uncharacterized protein LOC115701265 [Cannabis sativa]
MNNIVEIMNNENGNESSKNVKVRFDFDVPKINNNINNNKQEEFNISRQNSRSSSSSNYSPLSDDGKQEKDDDDEIINSDLSSPVTNNNNKDLEFSLQPKQRISYCDEYSSIFSPDISPHHQNIPLWSPQSLSPMHSSLLSLTPTTTTTTTKKANGYDPNRIPASIFSSKPSNPTEWSSTSNESLFSLHLGNTSFSKDQFLMLYKSGELNKLDEVMNLPPFFPTRSSYNNNHNQVVEASSSSSYQITAADQIFRSLHTEMESCESNNNNVELYYGSRDYNKINSNINRRNHMGTRRNNSISHLSYRSDESYNSNRSFNFPIFGSPTGESSKRYTAPQTQTQAQPLREMLRKHERSRVFDERRPKSFLHRWLTHLGCFSFCSTRRTNHFHDY